LKSTYVDALPKLINKTTGRIHTTYNQTVASTGRLSSTDPNLQNIPIRTDKGKEIRKAFIAKNDDYVIMSADYSQIELRIMAHICGDEQMIESFRQNHDIHSATASVLFSKPLAEVNQDMRRIAKTVNFGIMYGLGSFGLAQRLRLSRSEAKEIIDNYFAKYPGIKKYMDMTVEFTRKNGYAETLCGRRRYFSDIDNKNFNLRNAAERAAINLPIQGTASDMLKIAMITIHNEFAKNKYNSKMLLQVHDELVFEVQKSEIDEIKSLVIDKMSSALSLGEVPVIVETGIGSNWLEAH
jgi:DNA polymerase-1